ncbi:DNA alkylation repair protein [Flagellimonas lutimaris]|uniref:DNA alkylation repair protein n=1 Tax=Flagellimonas lutimaris TaxID=475082 RepID=A0A3A1N5C9_9FLAO|nr:DNA alkylation repair protein [Allomuricauda lutimaris]RIV31635.1 DNA alkylation repair protein [Allomuricauda lutimaris]
MAKLFKNIYNQKFFDALIDAVLQIKSDFDKKSFLTSIFDKEWQNRELKRRMRHIAIVLKHHLSENFSKNVDTLLLLIHQLENNGIKEESIEFMFIPDFIELYGLEDYNTSVKAFEGITQFTSCEFAVRPFIIKYEDKMMKQMHLWANHKHEMVRRLATEGCRPRLPWAMAIPSLKNNPDPIIPILERLKNDQSETVRRSVANNLNDISKDNPNTVIRLAKSWQGKTIETDWVIKHACRTLLKQGDSAVLKLFGFGSVENIKINNLEITTPKVKIGTFLEFTFELKNMNSSATKIRLEYGIYYQKANRTLSRKVYKISEKEYLENSLTIIHRKQSFKIITTRKFYFGKHQLSIIINGKEFNKIDFELIE